MSQRKEKYVRSLGRRMDDIQYDVRRLEAESFHHGVRLAVAEDELQEIRERRALDSETSGRREDNGGWTNTFLRGILAAAIIVYLMLMVCVLVRELISPPPETQAPGAEVAFAQNVSVLNTVDKPEPQWSGD